MNKLLLILLCLPFFSYGQKTYIPDDAFEQALINLNLDNIFDDSVFTSLIDTVTTLYLSNNGIEDLTGIEDFIGLRNLFCSGNQITDLDLSNNPNLIEFNGNNNLLTSLDVRNGNNIGLWYFTAVNNPQLYCIAVNDIAFTNSNWLKDIGCVFSTNCGSSSIVDHLNKRNILKVLDIFGRSVTPMPNSPLIYIYDDGSIIKKVIIE